ncbi:hypothetical protein STEG23_017414 [Scotinomys teguina]
MNPSSSAGEEKGATGGSSSSGSGAGSCCLGAEGGVDPRGAGAAAAAALEDPAAAGQKEKEEALEEKLRDLTFRKQVSYSSLVSMASASETLYDFRIGNDYKFMILSKLFGFASENKTTSKTPVISTKTPMLEVYALLK